MAAEIQAAGGTVEKFAGDAVMAAFGAPEALEDHAERALHTAFAMQRRLESDLALRIGVNTGEVVAGRSREDSSFVSGDAVNVAARLEQAADPGEILAGERTVAAARGAFEFGEPRTIEAKGKRRGVACRPVVRALSLMRPRGAGRVFVGRDDELDRLWRAYRLSAERASPVLVTVVGDAGVGKTRLMRELWQRLADQQPEPLRRTGRCLPYGEGITFWPLAEALKEHLGILESDSPEEVRRRLGERAILGLTLGLDVAGDLHPLAARDKLHAAWVAFVTEQASERPVVLLVEDAHWAEPPLLELLERLAREVRAPLLLLVTARPDFAYRWDVRVDTETIVLDPLAGEVASSLVDELAAELPADVRELIVRRAEGNPFFVEELVQLAGENGREIPDSVQAVLAARIDLLDEAEKAALQAAAVIGRAFWTGPMYELAGEHSPDLATLESRDFIRRRSASSLEGEIEYVFKHALTREVAYNGLTKARRARLHADFAQWLQRFGGGRDEHASLLAHHYAAAVRPEDVDVVWPDGGDDLRELRARAETWLERAADLAIGRYEIDDGVVLLHRALELETDEARQSDLWRKVGLANALKFDGEAFWTAMQRSLAACHDREICANTYADLALQTAIRSGMWPQRPQRELVQGWIDEALKLASPGGVAHAKALIADCFWNQQAGRRAADEAHSLSERLGDVQLRAYALNALSWLAFAEQEFAEAAGWAEQALGLVDEISDPDHLADVYEGAIPAFSGIGSLGEARRLAALHRQVVEPLTPHHRLHGVSLQLEVEELCANWDGILGSSERTSAAVDENLATPCIRNARSLLVTAVAAGETDDPERADALESRALEVALEGYDFVLAAPRARLALSRGDAAAAVALVPELRDFRMSFALAHAAARLDSLAAAGELEAVERESSRYLRPGSYTEPFALRALGLVHEDEELLERAEKRFVALGLDWYAGQTERLRRLRELAT
jgi:AAA ATPase domain/Adenylate and Guanylate cyclase catalytic domain